MATNQLHRQLWHFGLDPKEWLLDRISPGTYAIRHRGDYEIYFCGWAERMKWRALDVVI